MSAENFGGMEAAADFYLAEWARWSGAPSNLGYPRRSVTERANEGGIGAGSPRPPTVMPDEIALTDLAVAALGMRDKSILRKVIYLKYEQRTPIEGVAIALRINTRKAHRLITRAQRAVFLHREIRCAAPVESCIINMS